MSNPTVNIRIPFLLGNVHFEYALSLEEFNRLVAPVLDAAVQPIAAAMQKAGIRKGELGMVLLAGGSSQLPGIRERVWQQTGVEPFTIPRNLMYAVAYGAALYHRRIFQLPVEKREDRILGEDLGILVRDGSSTLFRLMLPHNAKLPAKCKYDFEVPEGQDVVTINLRRGQVTEVGGTKPIRSRNLNLKKPSDKIKVHMEVDRNRIIRLRAFAPDDPETEIAIEVNDILEEQELISLRRQFGLEVAASSEKGVIAPGRQPCIGIDVGTTTSEIAYTAPAGRPILQCLENSSDNGAYDAYCYPSVVYFANGWQSPEIANTAALNAVEDRNKQGIAFESFKIADWSRPLGIIEGKEVTVQILTAHLLAKMWRDAIDQLGKIGGLRSAVVTVPAAFGPDECLEMYNAAQLAGIEEVTLIDEPTAAFLYYQSEFPDIAGADIRNVLVFDFGGGTADVAILDVSNDPGISPGSYRHVLFEVLATAGDQNCGGKHIALKTGHSLKDEPAARLRLRRHAEIAKINLANLAMTE